MYNVALSPLKNKSIANNNTIYGYKNYSLTWDELGQALKTNAILACKLNEDYGEVQQWKPSECKTLGYTNLLVLDFDNEKADSYVSMLEWATVKAAEFNWYLCSTKSHNTAKAQGRDRYRVFIPLTKELNYMNNSEYKILLMLVLNALDISTENGAPVDFSSAVTSTEPKFEAPPINCVFKQSRTNAPLDVTELVKEAATMYHSNIEGLPDTAPKFYTTIDRGIIVLTAEYEEKLLSSFTEEEQVYCPQCEGVDSKSPSARVYIKDNGQANVYCHSNGCHTFIDTKLKGEVV